MVETMVSNGLKDKAEPYRKELARLYPEKAQILAVS